MSDAVLDPAEREAIQAAIRAGRPAAGAATAIDARDTARMTLLASERLAERATPALLRLGTRWAGEAPRTLAAHLPGQWRAAPLGCETVAGAALRELQRRAWIKPCRLAGAGPALAIAVEGDVIQRAAARRCGEGDRVAAVERAATPVSITAIRLFEPTGRAVAASWITAWRAVDDRGLVLVEDGAELLDELAAAPALTRLTLELTGDVVGQVTVFAPPAMLAQRELALEAHRADARAISEVLAGVPVELVVELGRFTMPLHHLGGLRQGATFELSTFVDASLPVRCGGALKAWGRPVLARGVMAIEIERAVSDPGVPHE
ncbi:MAG: FliM/FliN family flagellar motor switch protein [Kofleriaceae bacterium]